MRRSTQDKEGKSQMFPGLGARVCSRDPAGALVLCQILQSPGNHQESEAGTNA